LLYSIIDKLFLGKFPERIYFCKIFTYDYSYNDCFIELEIFCIKWNFSKNEKKIYFRST